MRQLQRRGERGLSARLYRLTARARRGLRGPHSTRVCSPLAVRECPRRAPAPWTPCGHPRSRTRSRAPSAARSCLLFAVRECPRRTPARMDTVQTPALPGPARALRGLRSAPRSPFTSRLCSVRIHAPRACGCVPYRKRKERLAGCHSRPHGSSAHGYSCRLSSHVVVECFMLPAAIPVRQALTHSQRHLGDPTVLHASSESMRMECERAQLMRLEGTDDSTVG